VSDIFCRSNEAAPLVQTGPDPIRSTEASNPAPLLLRRRYAEAYGVRCGSILEAGNHRRGWAYLVLGRFEDAVDAPSQTEFNDAHLLLAVAYARLGRPADARAEVGKMMKINPALTSQAWRLGYSFRDPEILDRYALDLVPSGLLEA
jgi:tetratricopeptide (TPR) repeat protein